MPLLTKVDQMGQMAVLVVVQLMLGLMEQMSAVLGLSLALEAAHL